LLIEFANNQVPSLVALLKKYQEKTEKRLISNKFRELGQ